MHCYYSIYGILRYMLTLIAIELLQGMCDNYTNIILLQMTCVFHTIRT